MLHHNLFHKLHQFLHQHLFHNSQLLNLKQLNLHKTKEDFSEDLKVPLVSEKNLILQLLNQLQQKDKLLNQEPCNKLLQQFQVL
jgi:hypothetical protein